MAVLFILVGLSIFLAGFTLYLKKAFATNRSWAYKCLLFPPLAILDFRNTWQTSKDSALLQLGGLFTLSIGLAFVLNTPGASSDNLKQQMSGRLEFNNSPSKKNVNTKKPTTVDSETLLDQINAEGEVTDNGLMSTITANVKNKVSEISEIAKEESSNLISNVQMNRVLTGQLNNQRFKPDVVTFKENRLRFNQGGKLIGDKEIIIILPENKYPVRSGYKLQVQPEQKDGPEIHLSWLEGDASIPETRILKTDYSLEIECELVTDDKLNARILLNYASGEFSGKLAGSFVAARDIPVSTDVLLNNVKQSKLETVKPQSNNSSSAKKANTATSPAPVPVALNNTIKKSNVSEYSETRNTNKSVESIKLTSKSTENITSEILEIPAVSEILESENVEIEIIDEPAAVVDIQTVKTVASDNAKDSTADGLVDGSVDSSMDSSVDNAQTETQEADDQGTIATPELTQDITVKEAMASQEAVLATPEVKPEIAPAPVEEKLILTLIPHTDLHEEYLKPETALVLQKLKPFWGKIVVITSLDDSTSEGLLKEFRRGEIAVEMRVGAGTMEKLIAVENFKSVAAK